MYDGIATLDKSGEVTITLPDYFMALNKDFRYLATAMGQPMPNLHLKTEVHKRWFGLINTPVFSISGGAANGRVSWQVTGIRHDPFILAHPIIVEVEKAFDTVIRKGTCLVPSLCK